MDLGPLNVSSNLSANARVSRGVIGFWLGSGDGEFDSLEGVWAWID